MLNFSKGLSIPSSLPLLWLLSVRLSEGAQDLDLAEAECDILGADLARGRPRPRDHVGRHVDADDLSGRTHLASGEEPVEAAAAA